MRRKRRSRGTWFPVYGDESGPEGTVLNVAGIDGTFSIEPSGQVQTLIHVLTADDPKEGDDDTQTLADIVGSEYLLKRLVGKFFCLYTGTNESPVYCKVTAGAFVARADAENSFYPLGAGSNFLTTTVPNDSFSPLAQETQREPWLWRRSWLLGNSANQNVSADPGSTTGTAKLAALAWEIVPPSTMGYGSVMDGPHIDAKTLRKVGQDDRLYFVVSGCRWPISTTPDPNEDDGLIVYHLDYRLFGLLRKARQVGRF